MHICVVQGSKMKASMHIMPFMIPDINPFARAGKGSSFDAFLPKNSSGKFNFSVKRGQAKLSTSKPCLRLFLWWRKPKLSGCTKLHSLLAGFVLNNLNSVVSKSLFYFSVFQKSPSRIAFFAARPGFAKAKDTY